MHKLASKPWHPMPMLMISALYSDISYKATLYRQLLFKAVKLREALPLRFVWRRLSDFLDLQRNQSGQPRPHTALHMHVEGCIMM